MVLLLATYNDMEWIHPALAIFEVSASNTCFLFNGHLSYLLFEATNIFCLGE